MPSCRRKADGRPKRAFNTEQAAAAFNTDPDMTPYRCPRCDRYHLGHRPGSTQMTIRARAAQRHHNPT